MTKVAASDAANMRAVLTITFLYLCDFGPIEKIFVRFYPDVVFCPIDRPWQQEG